MIRKPLASHVSDPQLSVLLPCHNAATHLPLAIRGLQLQTFRDFEVVAVNDGSQDETGALLDRWAKNDARVRVIHRKHHGLADTLQAGSRECRGQLIARVDADDVSHPRRFAEQVRFLSERRDITASGTWVRYFPRADVGWGARRYQAWLNRLAEPEALERDVFVECPIAHPTLTIRRSALARVGGYRVNGWPEDYDLILRLHLAGARLANVPKVLYFWRESPGRLSRTDPRYSADAFRECKLNYLMAGPLQDRGEAIVWGAGRVGKAFARALQRTGFAVRCFLDIDPRKISQEIYGAPVRDARDAAAHRGTYILVAVGAAGARELIREQLDGSGFREPGDYRCVA